MSLLVDNYLQAEMQKLNIPGLSVAIVEKGQVIKSCGYGFANIELQHPATAETVYQSGSLGKQFTAMLVMMLFERKALNLRDKVGLYLSTTPEHWKDITLLHLLTHTSGLQRNIPKIDLRRDYTHNQLIKKIASEPLNFQPGTQYLYSNSAYVLLGFILTKITGLSYNDLLCSFIFEPLNMHSARVISDRDIIPNRAAGYDLVNGVLKNQLFVSPTFNATADGALYFTVLDLAKWDAALYTTTLLKKENMDLLWLPVRLNNGTTANYGMGWRLATVNGHRFAEHRGEWQGFTAFMSRNIDKNLTVIILSNLSGNTHLQAITHHVANLKIQEEPNTIDI